MMFRKLDLQATVSDFGSLWVTYISDFLLNEAKLNSLIIAY